MTTTGPQEPTGEPADDAAPAKMPPDRVTRASAAWVATGAALVLLTLLIVFILQNQTDIDIQFFGFDGTIPTGMAMLIAAVAGGTLVAVAGIARVMQLRRDVRRKN